jgi:hypothetical protein
MAKGGDGSPATSEPRTWTRTEPCIQCTEEEKKDAAEGGGDNE